MIKTYANVYLSIKGLWTIELRTSKEMFWIYTIVQKFGVINFFYSKTTNYKHFNINYKAKYYISQKWQNVAK